MGIGAVGASVDAAPTGFPALKMVQLVARMCKRNECDFEDKSWSAAINRLSELT